MTGLSWILCTINFNTLISVFFSNNVVFSFWRRYWSLSSWWLISLRDNKVLSRSGEHKTKETYPTRPGSLTPCKQGHNSKTRTFSSNCTQIEYSARNSKILRILFVVPHQHFLSRQDGLEWTVINFSQELEREQVLFLLVSGAADETHPARHLFVTSVNKSC